jgi:uncharacterized protein (TIGR02271 family)
MEPRNSAHAAGAADIPHPLISSERVDGTEVYSLSGEKLGTIDHLMIDKYSGHVVYAVMSFGGFLGIGESYFPLPWDALRYDVDLGGYRVDLDRDKLEAAPRYSATGSNWSDRSYTDRVDQHWGHSRVREDRMVIAFASAEQARRAREALIAAGIENTRIDLLESRSDLDNWTSVKRHSVPDEDAHVYAECLGRGNSVLVIQARPGEHDRVMRAVGQFNPIDVEAHAAQWRQSGWPGVHAGKPASAVNQQTVGARTTARSTEPRPEEQVIPVYEEQLKVGKRVVEQGHVRVRVYTVEHPVQEGVTLREERVAIERRPVDRPVGATHGEAFQDRTIDVTTHREEPVVSKEARVKEEIVVRKDADQRTETLRENVRRTEVEVDDGRAPTPATPSTTPRR